MNNSISLHGTTVLSVKKAGSVVMAADGQVSLGNTILKHTAKKIQTLHNNRILAGFAGSTADALTLMERLTAKLEKHSYNLENSCIELAKDWRSDKYLRRLEAMLIVANKERTLLLTGMGDVIDPEDAVIAIGSGGHYALSAAKALLSFDNKLTALEIARISMNIAADICVFSNKQITILEAAA